MYTNEIAFTNFRKHLIFEDFSGKQKKKASKNGISLNVIPN